MLGHKKEATEEATASDYLQNAIGDLKEARKAAEEEFGSAIDSAIDRAVEALEKLTANVEERAEKLKERVSPSD
jgi:uncharacterized protein YjbJ (UPF0337 family)